MLRYMLVAILLLWSGAGRADEAADKGRLILQEAIKDPDDPAKLAAFKATLVEAPAGSGLYLVEGDYLISESELKSYLRRLRNPVPDLVSSIELIVNAPGGKLDYVREPADRKCFTRLTAHHFRIPMPRRRFPIIFD